MAPKKQSKDFKPTHKVVRPIKHDGVFYKTGETLELDDEQAQTLGHHVDKLIIPASAMTAAELKGAAVEAEEREKAEAKAAKTAKAKPHTETPADGATGEQTQS